MPTYNEIALGGAKIAGLPGGTPLEFVIYFLNATTGTFGNSLINGLSKNNIVISEIVVAGCKNSGLADFSKNLTYEVMFGVGYMSGISTSNIIRTVVASNGVVLSGISERTDPVNHYPNFINYNPLITVSGNARLRFSARFDTENGVIVRGDSRLRQGLSYIASDGITLSDNNEYKLVLKINLDLLWRIRSQIIFDRTIVWDTGQLRQYFYRVVGREREDECDQLPCCMIFVVNIHATTIANLCEKLRERQFRWPIESVHRFTRPAETVAIAEDESLGIDHLCNELEEVDICPVPICGEFCITADAVINVGCTTLTPQVNAWFFEEAEWDLIEGESSIIISGEATSTSAITIFALYFTSGNNLSSDNLINIEGESEISSSGYQVVSEGVLTVAGVSEIVTENWTYIGGNWPYESFRYPRVAGIVEASPIGTESISSWLQLDRVFTSNNLSTFVDVSWNASSDYLLVKSFNFNLPENTTVGLINIGIERRATFNVRDYEVYLVIGNEIISPNLANPSYFPLFDTITRYRVIDDSFSQTIPGVARKIGGWTTDTINDTEFGVLVRVIGQIDITGVLAYIDAIGIQLYYEDNSDQILRPRGEAGIVADSWITTASGGLLLTSDNVFVVDFNYNSFGGIDIQGFYTRHFSYEGTIGTVEISGESRTICNHYVPEGGFLIAGESRTASSSYTYSGDEGVGLSGEYFVRMALKKISGTGGILIEGEATTFPIQGYDATGNVILSGSSSIVTSVWSWISDGNTAFMGGAAEFRVSNFDNLFADLGFQMNVIDVQLIFGSDVETGTLKTSSDVISVCGCVDIPLVLNLSHNLVNRNKFSHFLARNNLFMPRKIKLYHNAINNMWQTNFNFKGLSADFNALESWNLLFDIKCTQIVGGIDVGREILALSMQMTQKNINTLEDFSTRMIIGFLPDVACANGILQTKITYNTKLDVATVKAKAQIYYYSLFDDLDLFKNEYWYRNPELKIDFTSVNLDKLQYRQNMDIVFHHAI